MSLKLWAHRRPAPSHSPHSVLTPGGLQPSPWTPRLCSVFPWNREICNCFHKELVL